ncbi:hypothetical protein MNBD_GAMMA06-21, partial [hydrothermal vent metagenome]
MKRNSIYAVIISCLLWAQQGSALTLSLSPNSQIIAPSGIATVDLVASDLGNFVAPTVGAFSIEILFDESIIAFDSVEYGALLGNPMNLFETDIITTVNPDSVELDEFSFLADFELDALQPETFTLATLTFSGLLSGVSFLDFGFIDVSDAVGFTLTPSSLTPSEITVTAVPLP